MNEQDKDVAAADPACRILGFITKTMDKQDKEEAALRREKDPDVVRRMIAVRLVKVGGNSVAATAAEASG